MNCGIDDAYCCGVQLGGSGDVGSAPSSEEVAAVWITEGHVGSSDVVSAAAAAGWVVPYR